MQEINIYATQNTIGWKRGKKNIYISIYLYIIIYLIY